MSQKMIGKVVALAASRKVAEMGKLIENMGGTPVYRPAQGTVFLDNDKIREELVSWIENPPEWVILTTGMGLEALFAMAENMGIEDKFLEILSTSSIAARGYKTVNALKRRQLTPVIRDDDGSSEGLIRSFESYDIRGANVILQLHGDSAPKLTKWLDEKGATTKQILPYRHEPPEEQHLEQLIQDIVQARIDAVTFTSAPQFRFLMEYAREHNEVTTLINALENKVVAVAVGKVTAQALKEEGIQRIIMPEEERMGSMMVELGRYFASQSESEVAVTDEE